MWACDVWVRWCVEWFAMWTVMAVCLGQDGSTPLLAAVAGSHDTIVKGLLEKHADVNAMSKVCVFVGCCVGIVRGGRGTVVCAWL